MICIFIFFFKLFCIFDAFCDKYVSENNFSDIKCHSCYRVKIEKTSLQHRRASSGAQHLLRGPECWRESAAPETSEEKDASRHQFSWSYLRFLQNMLEYISLTSSKLFAFPSSRLKASVGELRARVTKEKPGLCWVSPAFLVQGGA